MKLFPSQKYSIVSKNDSLNALTELRKQTLSREQYFSNWDNQSFIGIINTTDFEIELSRKLYGSFCVLKGKLENQNGILEITMHKTFKLIFIAFFLFAIIGFLISLLNNGFENSTKLLLQTVLFIFVLRFVIIELGFRVISKKGLHKLIEIIGIETVRKSDKNS